MQSKHTADSMASAPKTEMGEEEVEEEELEEGGEEDEEDEEEEEREVMAEGKCVAFANLSKLTEVFSACHNRVMRFRRGSKASPLISVSPAPGGGKSSVGFVRKMSSRVKIESYSEARASTVSARSLALATPPLAGPSAPGDEFEGGRIESNSMFACAGVTSISIPAHPIGNEF